MLRHFKSPLILASKGSRGGWCTTHLAATVLRLLDMNLEYAIDWSLKVMRLLATGHITYMGGAESRGP